MLDTANLHTETDRKGSSHSAQGRYITSVYFSFYLFDKQEPKLDQFSTKGFAKIICVIEMILISKRI